MYRTEDKYILPSWKMYEIETRMMAILRPDIYSSKNGYTISSLYFDDFRDDAYEATLAGNPQRDKFRVRIYNNSFDIIKLEVKRKLYNKARKLTSKITFDELRRLCKGEIIDDNSNLQDARTAFNLAITTKRLRPRIIVSYERKAYIAQAGNVRITFDRNIRASRACDKFGTPNLIWDYTSGTGSVLEVKYDELIPKYIKQLIECNYLIQTSNSKYCMCREIYEMGEG